MNNQLNFLNKRISTSIGIIIIILVILLAGGIIGYRYYQILKELTPIIEFPPE